jgi:hypothetical protein
MIPLLGTIPSDVLSRLVSRQAQELIQLHGIEACAAGRMRITYCGPFSLPIASGRFRCNFILVARNRLQAGVMSEI